MFITIFSSHTLALIPSVPGWAEIGILLVIGLLIFGKRLPEVGRNLGRSIIEFKKGIKGIDDEINTEANRKSADQIEESDSDDQAPAKVTPDPASEVDELKHPLDD